MLDTDGDTVRGMLDTVFEADAFVLKLSEWIEVELLRDVLEVFRDGRCDVVDPMLLEEAVLVACNLLGSTTVVDPGLLRSNCFCVA